MIKLAAGCYGKIMRYLRNNCHVYIDTFEYTDISPSAICITLHVYKMPKPFVTTYHTNCLRQIQQLINQRLTMMMMFICHYVEDETIKSCHLYAIILSVSHTTNLLYLPESTPVCYWSYYQGVARNYCLMIIFIVASYREPLIDVRLFT